MPLKNARKLHSVKNPVSFFRRVRLKYHRHECSPSCIEDTEKELLSRRPDLFFVTDDGIFMKKGNTFFMPIYFQYRRVDRENEHGDAYSFFVSPCGLVLENYGQIWKYLKTTQSRLGIDQFALCPSVFLHRPHDPFRVFYHNPDISAGQEIIPIHAINELDTTAPETFEYCKEMQFSKKASQLIQLEEPKLCCSCENDCEDQTKCACQLKTHEEQRILGETKTYGYEYKRLLQPLVSAVFECNSKCSCNKRCFNRVVQNGIKTRLQVYKTKKRGWAVRTLYDIPKGVFVCAFIGQVMTNEEFSDSLETYAMNLDYLKMLENIKRFRSQLKNLPITQSDNLFDETKSEKISVQENSSNAEGSSEASSMTLAESTSLDSNESSDNEDSDEFMDSMCEVEQKPQMENYIKEINLFLCDAKNKGNVARFLNHSCSPNLMLQNVFIEKQDQRAPIVAFFSRKRIKAFAELTWNYGISGCKKGFIHCRCKAH